MTLDIRRADFADPALSDFLQAHLDDLEPTAPAESRHALDLSALQRDGVRLWVAVDGGIVGTAALAEIQPGNEELKSMRTDPVRRGQGIARRLLQYVLADARARGVQQIWLETGSMDFFAAARALYASEGFVECVPFGSYVEDPNSTFMTLRL
ncbi:MAG TPA: GNAT family N-acetyltransferase [Microlunatus sp.]